MKPFEIALKEYGTKRIAGAFHNAEVIKYFKEIGQDWVRNDETAWCAAFLNWCLMKAGKPFSSSLMARNFLSYGVSTKKPEIGDIVVLWRVAKNSPYGHAGFYIKETKNSIFILGGNQSDEVNIKEYDKGMLLDYRKITTATTRLT